MYKGKTEAALEEHNLTADQVVSMTMAADIVGKTKREFALLVFEGHFQTINAGSRKYVLREELEEYLEDLKYEKVDAALKEVRAWYSSDPEVRRYAPRADDGPWLPKAETCRRLRMSVADLRKIQGHPLPWKMMSVTELEDDGTGRLSKKVPMFNPSWYEWYKRNEPVYNAVGELQQANVSRDTAGNVYHVNGARYGSELTYRVSANIQTPSVSDMTHIYYGWEELDLDPELGGEDDIDVEEIVDRLNLLHCNVIIHETGAFDPANKDTKVKDPLDIFIEQSIKGWPPVHAHVHADVPEADYKKLDRALRRSGGYARRDPGK